MKEKIVGGGKFASNEMIIGDGEAEYRTNAVWDSDRKVVDYYAWMSDFNQWLMPEEMKERGRYLARVSRKGDKNP